MEAELDGFRAEAMNLARARLAKIEENKALYDADLATFATDCLTIRPKKGADMLFRFNSVQRRVHAVLEEQKQQTGRVRALVLKARQPGVSTYIEGRFFHKITKTKGISSFILTHSSLAFAASVRSRSGSGTLAW